MNKQAENSTFYNYLKLGKYTIIIPVSLTAFTGFFLYNPTIDLNIILVSLGVFFLGIAASTLNQVQERNTDAKMLRTMNRPIPAGKISGLHAIVFTVLNFILGGSIIYIGGNIYALWLGILTIIWYNGIYTPLKRISAFAVIPGSLTGAIPPIIGWTAAGGNPFDLTALILAFLFFMGQVPHFWLLILKYGEQYKQAGLPALTDIFSIRQINNLSFTWISASLIAALMLGLFGVLQKETFRILLIIITIIAIFLFRKLINKEESVGTKKYFIELNVYYVILIILLLADKIASL
ncbi:MAG: protoheme IX farnesyltransferase [Bacteroidota bacterium]